MKKNNRKNSSIWPSQYQIQREVGRRWGGGGEEVGRRWGGGGEEVRREGGEAVRR